VGFPKLQAGAEGCLGWGSSLAGRINPKDVPLLIRALSVRRLGVDDQARRALSRIAGRDLGAEPGPWLEWWATERRSRGLSVPAPRRPGAAPADRPAKALLRGWQIVLIQVLVTVGLVFLCATQGPPMQVAVAGCALGLFAILAIPRLGDVRRRRRGAAEPRGCCRNERRS
jgi:hypothetical protein